MDFRVRTLACLVLVLLVEALCGGVSVGVARNINWAGYSWWVRTSGGNPQGPGPNIFSDSTENVFVDGNGDLHLKIRQGTDGKWLASEIDMNQSLGYGTYEWEVSSRYDQFATNVVGGLFTYLDPHSVAAQTGGVVGNGVPDTAHEIDIEFTSAWGSANLYHTTHDPDIQSPSKNYYQALTGDFTTHRFTWEPDKITWESFNGHVGGVENPPNPIVEQRPGASQGQPAKYVYSGPVVPEDLNEITIINFWISSNNASVNGPTNGLEQEMIIHSFTYTPLPEPLLGDYNQNDIIDAADYTVWRDALSAGSMMLPNDPTPGTVNQSDYIYWRDHFGDTLSSGSSSATINNVPEPTSNCLVVLGAILLLPALRAARHAERGEFLDRLWQVADTGSRLGAQVQSGSGQKKHGFGARCGSSRIHPVMRKAPAR